MLHGFWLLNEVLCFARLPKCLAGLVPHFQQTEKQDVESQCKTFQTNISLNLFLGDEWRQLAEAETQLAEEEGEYKKAIDSLHPPLEEDPLTISSEKEVVVKVEEEEENDEEAVKWHFAMKGLEQ